jgi:hypothetical protein
MLYYYLVIMMVRLVLILSVCVELM